MRRAWILATASTALLGQLVSAQGADLAPIYKAPVAVAETWTGFFVGAHVGAHFSNRTFVDNFPVFDGDIDATPSLKSWAGGLQGGVNYQMGWLVLGLGAEFTWLGPASSFTCFPFGTQVCSANPEWAADVTARVGAAVGPALLYVKGGPAWAHDSFTDVATCSGSQPRIGPGIPSVCGDEFAGSDTRPGWTVGAGIEYRLARHWSAFVEYDYYKFRDRSVALEDGLGNFFTEEIHEDMHVVKAGLNYRFGPYLGLAAASGDDSPKSVLAFGGAEVGKHSYFGFAGVLIAPWLDLDTSGPRVWLVGSAGAYKYFGGGTEFKGVHESGDALVGYGFEGNNYSANALIGLSASNHTISPHDFENRVQGTQGGVKGRVDAYTNPTSQTMIYGEAEYSTAFGEYLASVKLGYDVTRDKGIFIGPVASVLGDERYNQWQLGAHVSGLKVGPVQVDVSGGYADDSVVGKGAFARFEASAPF